MAKVEIISDADARARVSFCICTLTPTAIYPFNALLGEPARYLTKD